MELSGFSFIMCDIRKLVFQLHMLSLAGKFFAVSGEISIPCSVVIVNTRGVASYCVIAVHLY